MYSIFCSGFIFRHFCRSHLCVIFIDVNDDDDEHDDDVDDDDDDDDDDDVLGNRKTSCEPACK